MRRIRIPTYVGGDLAGHTVEADTWNFQELSHQLHQAWDAPRGPDGWQKQVVKVETYQRVTYQVGPGVIVDAYMLEGADTAELVNVLGRLIEKGIAVLAGVAGSGVEDDGDPTSLFGYPAVLELIGTPGGPLRMNLPMIEPQSIGMSGEPRLDFKRVSERIQERLASPGGRPAVR